MITPPQLRVREATPEELANWDGIVRRFPNHRVPHLRAWIDALAASNCGTPLYLLLEDDAGIVGALPGLIVKVGRWRLFGSPLEGWQTVSLGPAFDPARLSMGSEVRVMFKTSGNALRLARVICLADEQKSRDQSV